jgi:hypothetical protein
VSGLSQGVSPIFFSADGAWGTPRAEFPRGTMEVEATVTAALFTRGDLWETLWEWNQLPHIYDFGTWQQRGSVERWTFRLFGDDDPLTPGSYRLTVWRNRQVVAQGDFYVRGPDPPRGGQLSLSELYLYQRQGRHLVPLSRRGDPPDAIGATLGYCGLPSSTPLHVIWRCNGLLVAVENRLWQGPAAGDELLVYVPRAPGPLTSGRYELEVSCWPAAPLKRTLHHSR